MDTRNTIQRALVLEAVRETNGHMTADEVYQAVSGQHPNISRGTVYRNLQRLSQTGEIRKIEVPGGADRYDRILKDHYHVKCETCGRIFDVDMEYMSGLEHGIRDTHGFILYGHDVMFRGICPDCQKTPPSACCHGGDLFSEEKRDPAEHGRQKKQKRNSGSDGQENQNRRRGHDASGAAAKQ